MKKERIKKTELSEYLNCSVVLERYHCFNQNLEILYNNALSKNIVLQYHKKDLKQYIEEQKSSLLEAPSEDELYNEFKKKNNRLMIKKALFRTILFLSLYSFHVTDKNIKIQETSNVINSILMIDNLSTDSNNDGILEIDTSLLNYINEYSDPGDDKYFYNTNIFYRLSDYVQISDCLSFSLAMDKLGHDIIEIDGVLYSKTGNITKIIYIEDNEKKIKYTSNFFESEEDILIYLHENNGKNYYTNILIVNISSHFINSFEDIPTIKKSKDDGTINVLEPSSMNKILVK